MTDEECNQEETKGCLIGCVSVLLLVVMIVGSLLMWVSSLFNDSLSKREIFKLVNREYSVVLEDIIENDFSDTENIKGIKKVCSGIGIVDVYCGGKGVGSSTSYYGFYYSSDGMPKQVWCGKTDGSLEWLKSDGKGFSVKNPDDDNWYYTEKIRDNFYYYESHF